MWPKRKKTTSLSLLTKSKAVRQHDMTNVGWKSFITLSKSRTSSCHFQRCRKPARNAMSFTAKQDCIVWLPLIDFTGAATITWKCHLGIKEAYRFFSLDRCQFQNFKTKDSTCLGSIFNAHLSISDVTEISDQRQTCKWLHCTRRVYCVIAAHPFHRGSKAFILTTI